MNPPDDSEIIIRQLVNGPFQENCWLVGDPATKRCTLVDPGSSAEGILEFIDQMGLKLDKITNTHGHMDHAGAVAPIKRERGVGFWIHRGETMNLQSMPKWGPLMGMGDLEVPEVEHWIEDGDEIPVGNLTLKSLATPGHTAGGVSFLVGGRHLFVGDTIFQGSVGRTDLPGGNYDTLIESIRTKILPLPDDTLIYSGHGPVTTLGHERRRNPFILKPELFREQMVSGRQGGMMG
ncbi:MAG: MBL fold metallo-hydrolase [Deltaproteobacteria bacterium]|nr:MBL fold metallo-hydrolase [Deltaproteobacteria bacterium]